jgi:hypothetical protein
MMNQENRIQESESNIQYSEKWNHEAPGAAEPQPKYFTQRRKGTKKKRI